LAINPNNASNQLYSFSGQEKLFEFEAKERETDAQKFYVFLSPEKM